MHIVIPIVMIGRFKTLSSREIRMRAGTSESLHLKRKVFEMSTSVTSKTTDPRKIVRFPSLLVAANSLIFGSPVEIETQFGENGGNKIQERVYFKSMEREDGSGLSWNIRCMREWGAEKAMMYVPIDNLTRAWIKSVPEFEPHPLPSKKAIVTSTTEITWFPTDLELVSGLLLHKAVDQSSVPFQVEAKNSREIEGVYLYGIERIIPYQLLAWGRTYHGSYLVRMHLSMKCKRGTMEFFN